MSKLQHQFHTLVAINMLVLSFVFMPHPNIYLLKNPRALGVLQRTTGFADRCLYPVFSVCHQIKNKKKKPERKIQQKENMACEYYRAKSAEFNVTSSQAIWRAWISYRVGKFKAQSIADTQSELQQTICSKFWRINFLGANQVDRTKLNLFNTHGNLTWERMDWKPSKGFKT